MLVLAWVIIFVVASAFFEGRLSTKNTPNTNPDTVYTAGGYKQVTLQSNNKDQYIVTGHINRHPVQFLVDTGATDVAISKDLADKLTLTSTHSGYAHTANGRVKVDITQLRNLGIGEIELYDIEAIISDSLPSDFVLLGMSALKKLDFRHHDNQLILEQGVDQTRQTDNNRAPQH